ncbi:MAG: FGGY-family carbohydrate kinase [Streptosporangiaceae bacterium]
MTDALLGVDIGTSSTKAVVAAPSGAVLAAQSTRHAIDLPSPGFAEQDAERVWWQDVVTLCRSVTKAAGQVRIAGVTVSGMGPCLLPCGPQIEPLRPAILYGIDTRAEAEIRELTAVLGAREIVASGGSALSSQAVGPKMAWLRRHEPELWRRTRFVHTAHSFVTHRLTGEYVLDHHTASQFDPLYDMRAGGWHPRWSQEVAGGVELPRLAWPGEVIGAMTPQAASLTGVPAGTPVIQGTVDAWAEAASAGVTSPGDLMIMYGSTMFLVLCVADARFDQAIWSTAGVFPETQTYAAGMATSGLLISWLCDLSGLDFAAAGQAAAAVPPGADGLICLPYFAGERSPLFDPAARGAFAGLSLRHHKGHLIRAGYEAVAYGIRHNLEVMARLGARPDRAVAVGGGTTGGLWTQIVSDVTGLAQEVPRVTIGAAYGDAYLAALGTGLARRDTSWNTIAQVVTPDPASGLAYADGYRTYLQLGEALLPVSHSLAAAQRGGHDPARDLEAAAAPGWSR